VRIKFGRESAPCISKIDPSFVSTRRRRRPSTADEHAGKQRDGCQREDEKSSVGSARDCEYLGFAFTGKRVTITVAAKKLKTFKRRIKELTGRSRGISMDRRLTDLNRYVRIG